MKKVPILVDDCPICTGYMILNGGVQRRSNNGTGEIADDKYTPMYALSRFYHELYICPGCGVREAMFGWFWEENKYQVFERARIRV